MKAVEKKKRYISQYLPFTTRSRLDKLIRYSVSKIAKINIYLLLMRGRGRATRHVSVRKEQKITFMRILQLFSCQWASN